MTLPGAILEVGTAWAGADEDAGCSVDGICCCSGALGLGDCGDCANRLVQSSATMKTTKETRFIQLPP